MKTYRIILLSFSLLSLTFFISCTSTLYVGPKQTDCVEGAGKPCYLIRSEPEGNWVLHDEVIIGLDYEQGFLYTLKVKKANAEERTQSGTDAEYAVVQVMEKKDVTEAILTDDLLNKEWKMELLKVDGKSYTPTDQPPTMTFEENGRITGFAGCNRYFGGYTLGGRTITCSEIGATKMFCQETMELEDHFLKAISTPMRALFSNGKLMIYADHGVQMIFGYK